MPPPLLALVIVFELLTAHFLMRRPWPKTIITIKKTGSEAEHVRHSLGEFVLGRRGVDFNGGQFKTRRFLAEDVREHPIAFE